MTNYFVDMYINQIFGFAYVVTEGIFVLSVVIISNRISLTLKGILKVLLQWFLVWAALIVVATVWQYMLNIGNSEVPGVHVQGNFTFMPVILCLYMLIFSRYKLGTRIVVMCTFYSSYQAILSISEGIGFIVRETYATSLDMTVWINVVMVLALVAFLYHFNFDAYIFVPLYCIVLMCICSVVVFAAILIARETWEERDYFLILSALLLVLDLLCYGMFTSVAQQYGRSVTQQVMHDRKAGARDMLLISQASYDNMHIVLHDIKNQFATLRALLDAQKYDEAREFMDKFEIFASPVIEAVDCGNVVVDSAMSVELAKARKKNVVIDSSVVVPPMLAITDSDLVSVICNLIDNAIEACVKEESSGPVQVVIRYQREYLMINVLNPVSETEGGKRAINLRTDKLGSSHGYGTRIVKDIAEKYNGFTKYSIEDGKFDVSVMLAVPISEENVSRK